MLRWLTGEISVELLSPLSPEMCIGVLRYRIDPLWAVLGDRPVAGWARKNTFGIRKRLPVYFRNSFQCYAYGRLQESFGQTCIAVRLKTNRLAEALTVFYFLWVFLFGGSISVSLVGRILSGTLPPGEAFMCGIPLAMLGFVYALVRIGRWSARNEPRFLIEFLCAELQAEILGPDQQLAEPLAR